MSNKNIPTQADLPSTAKLIKSTIIAAITAGVLLVTVVMPAEYGIDPTGVGKIIGLKKMGEIKVSLAAEAAAEEQIVGMAGNGEALSLAETVPAPAPVEPAAAEPATNIRTDEIQVTLAPDEGTEIKVTMAKGKKVEYSWETSGGKANFDVHADSKELDIDYHGYEKGSEQTKKGIIEAAFDGKHGWFWRNRTSETITVTLKTNGEYTEIQHMK
ncbi:MAG: transmembrane anchor protein [Alphaproteobacteria bacterium]